MDWANLGWPCLLVRPLTTNQQFKEGLRIPYYKIFEYTFKYTLLSRVFLHTFIYRIVPSFEKHVKFRKYIKKRILYTQSSFILTMIDQ